jgi:hypothetical protein
MQLCVWGGGGGWFGVIRGDLYKAGRQSVLVKVATPMEHNVPSCSVVQWYCRILVEERGRAVCVRRRLVARCSAKVLRFVQRHL